MWILRPRCTEQLRKFVSSKQEQTKIQEVWLCIFAYILDFCLNIYSSFWLLPPHANILSEGADTPIFISLHIPLNHIWHHWFLRCPGPPEKHPSANVRAIPCIQDIAGLCECITTGGTEAHWQVLQSTYPQLPRTVMTHRNTQQEKLEEFSSPSPLCFSCPLCPPVLVWLLLCPSIVLKGLQSTTSIPDSLSSKNK